MCRSISASSSQRGCARTRMKRKAGRRIVEASIRTMMCNSIFSVLGLVCGIPRDPWGGT